MPEVVLHLLDVLRLLVKVSSKGGTKVVTLEVEGVLLAEFLKSLDPSVGGIIALAWREHHMRVLKLVLTLVLLDCAVGRSLDCYRTFLSLFGIKRDATLTVLVGLHPHDFTECEANRVLHAEGAVIEQPHQSMHPRVFLLGHFEYLCKLVLNVCPVRIDVLSKRVLSGLPSVPLGSE